MKKEFNPRLSRELNLRENEYEIESDFKLILSLLKELLFYIIMLVPNLLAMLFFLIIGKTEKVGEFFSKYFLNHLKYLQKYLNGFFRQNIQDF